MASVRAKHCRIQIGKIDMASHAWPDRNSGKSGIIAYLSCSYNNQFLNYDFTNFLINMIVFDEKTNKTCKPSKNFVAIWIHSFGIGCYILDTVPLGDGLEKKNVAL